jgi:hypothetical protein
VTAGDGRGASVESAKEAWRSWCRALEETGTAVLGNGLTDDDVDLAECLRYLGRISQWGFFGNLERIDGAHPYFWPYLSPFAKVGGDNPQGLYLASAINPTDTFVVRGRRGSARWFSAIVMRAPAAYLAGEAPVGADLYLPDLAVADDGTFEILVSPEPHEGNWIASDQWAEYLLVRQFFGTPDDVDTMQLTIENVTEGATVPAPLSLDAAVAGVHRAATMFSRSIPRFLDELASKPLPNTFKTDIGDPTSGGGVPGGNAVTARWLLEADEALLVRVRPPVPCGYWDVQVGNGWYETFDYRHHFSGLTDAAAHSDDGLVTLVLAEQDPGTVNWLETAGHRAGHLAIRWTLTEGQLPIPETEVVPVADVARLTGLPTVSPGERAAQRALLAQSLERRFRAW